MESALAKIAITSESDEALMKSLDRINAGFEGGRLTKTDLSSWLIIHAAQELSETAITEIRQAHFNQVTYLDTLVKKLKSSGRENLDPQEMSTIQAMLTQQTQKKRSKPVKVELSPSKPTENSPNQKRLEIICAIF